jgi:hypothetical protein
MTGGVLAGSGRPAPLGTDPPVFLYCLQVPDGPAKPTTIDGSEGRFQMKRLASALALATTVMAVGAQVVFAWPGDARANLSSTPTGLAAGETWTVDITFVSQGRVLSPDSIRPVVVVQEVTTGATRTFETRATGVAGVFRADVVFPRAGTWSYKVAPSEYGPFFAYPAVNVKAAAAPVGQASSAPAEQVAPDLGIVGASAALTGLALLLGLGLAATRRRPRSTTNDLASSR